jgi:hypothetical protein
MRPYKLLFTTITLLILITCVFAQTSAKPSPLKPLNPIELEKLASTTSLEQAILRAAAEQARQQKRPVSSIQLQVTVAPALSGPCYTICIGPSHICRNACF